MLVCVCVKTIDTEKRGYIEAETMRELLITKGTPFREKELEGAEARGIWLVSCCVVPLAY